MNEHKSYIRDSSTEKIPMSILWMPVIFIVKSENAREKIRQTFLATNKVLKFYIWFNDILFIFPKRFF